MNIEKLDKIVINNDELTNISKWVHEQHFDSLEIPLDEVFIIIKDMEHMGLKASMGVYFNVNKETSEMHIKLFDMQDMFMLMSATIGEDFFENHEVKITSMMKLYTEELAQRTGKAMLLLCFDIFQYMVNRTELVESEEKVNQKVKKSSKSKNKKSSSKQKYVRIKTTRYTFINPDEVTDEKRGYERQAEAWTVRGHWRYMKKTGKRVWIKGYEKGSGEKESKVYKV